MEFVLRYYLIGRNNTFYPWFSFFSHHHINFPFRLNPVATHASDDTCLGHIPDSSVLWMPMPLMTIVPLGRTSPWIPVLIKNIHSVTYNETVKFMCTVISLRTKPKWDTVKIKRRPGLIILWENINQAGHRNKAQQIHSQCAWVTLG